MHNNFFLFLIGLDMRDLNHFSRIFWDFLKCKLSFNTELCKSSSLLVYSSLSTNSLEEISWMTKWHNSVSWREWLEYERKKEFIWIMIFTPKKLWQNIQKMSDDNIFFFPNVHLKIVFFALSCDFIHLNLRTCKSFKKLGDIISSTFLLAHHYKNGAVWFCLFTLPSCCYIYIRDFCIQQMVKAKVYEF